MRLRLWRGKRGGRVRGGGGERWWKRSARPIGMRETYLAFFSYSTSE
jgi:hypothetical protein